VNAVIAGQLEAMNREFGGPAFDAGRFEEAGRLFGEMVTGAEFADFLTLEAYNYID